VIHYHGTPITPRSKLLEMGGANFCVSFADKRDIEVAHQIGASVMIDNGAFTMWKKDRVVDWSKYYEFCSIWLSYHTTWAVVPDVIDGGEQENDALIAEWPLGKSQSGVVWHMHESIDRLLRLIDEGWAKVCIGSSGDYAQVGTKSWHDRMTIAMNAACPDGVAPVWFHMMRGMALSDSHYPFSSVDSTDIARNHHEGRSIRAMQQRWDSVNCTPYWSAMMEQEQLL